MSGELKDDIVVIRDQKEGCQLYNKGNFGYPLKGGGSELDLMEAVFLLECDRLEVLRDGRPMTFVELFEHASTVCEGFDIKFLVYRDIRQRGFVVKSETGGFDFAVFPRGTVMSNARPIYMVRAVSERTALDITDFAGEISRTEDKGKKLLYGVADEEGDLTYYIMSTENPRGSVSDEVLGKVSGMLISDRVFVFDQEGSEILRKEGFYGKMLGSVLQLSLIEGCYLSSMGALDVTSADGRIMSTEELKKFAMNAQDEFDLRLATFADLRSRGLVVKTGFKYGTHFRVYEGSPDSCHARYLVHAVSASKVTMWPEISRTVRLSGGVKKDILFCRVSGRTEYLQFKWFRP